MKIKNSGCSKNVEFPFGCRRKAYGKELAPRSLRKMGLYLLSECTMFQLVKAEVIKVESNLETY